MTGRYLALCTVCFARGWKIKLATNADHAKVPGEEPAEPLLEQLSVFNGDQIIAREWLADDDKLEEAADRILAGLREAGLIEAD